MIHVDALSRLFREMLVVKDNLFELNLALNQGRDSKLCELKRSFRNLMIHILR